MPAACPVEATLERAKHRGESHAEAEDEARRCKAFPREGQWRVQIRPRPQTPHPDQEIAEAETSARPTDAGPRDRRRSDPPAAAVFVRRDRWPELNVASRQRRVIARS